MSTYHGQFVWCELMTTDAKAATAFYRSVVGWGVHDSGMSDRQYLILNAGEVPVGGMMEWPEAGHPFWIGYIAVDDVDAIAERVKNAGGGIHRAPDDIPGVGRFAVVSDPQGASFTLFKPKEAGTPPPPAGGTPGRVGWHELHAADWEAAFAFYENLFGWTKAEAVDMGPMGTYQLFATGDTAVGGMMKKHESMPAPAWVYYFNVAEINAAATRVKDAGGTILSGPHPVPGGSWIAQCLDPQGAMFAIVAPPA